MFAINLVANMLNITNLIFTSDSSGGTLFLSIGLEASKMRKIKMFLTVVSLLIASVVNAQNLTGGGLCLIYTTCLKPSG